VPHIYKPEVKFVELLIEKFIPRGKKVKEDDAMQTPILLDKLSVAESSLIDKYFHQSGDPWKPSLIAFPHFQTFPSRIQKVMHSFKTGLLIDTMQHLQGDSYARDSKTSFLEDEVCIEKFLGADTVEQHGNREELHLFDDLSNQNSPDEQLGCEASPTQTSETKKKHTVCDLTQQSPARHSCLFGSDVISVDALGKVVIVSVPSLPFKGLSHSKLTNEGDTVLDTLNKLSCHLKISDEDNKDQTIQAEAVADLITTQTKYINNGTPRSLGNADAWPNNTFEVEKIPQTPTRKGNLSDNGDVESQLPDAETRCMNHGTPRSLDNVHAWPEKTFEEVERVPQTPTGKGNLSDKEEGDSELPDAKRKASFLLPDEYSNDFGDTELSPRLTNMIKSGFVPESPVSNGGLNGKERDMYLFHEPVLSAQLHTEVLSKPSSPGKNERIDMDSNNHGKDVPDFPINNEVHTPILNKDSCASIRGCTATSPIIDTCQSPLVDLTNDSSSKNWRLSSADKSESVKRTHKFKRLRKLGDCGKNKNIEGMKESPIPKAKLRKSVTRRNIKTGENNIRAFIDEEAEVSTDTDVSDDEEDDQHNNSYDSFIDDRTSPTAVGTLPETSRTDMMAIYRRSLLSQSPMPRLPSAYTNVTPDSVATTTRTRETGSCPGKTFSSLQTPLTDSVVPSTGKDLKSFQTKENSEAVPCTTGVSSKCEGAIASKKRKLSFCPSNYVPAINLEQEFEAAGEPKSMQHCDANSDMLCDDEFFEGLDLDAIEAQATLLLKQKSELLTQKQEVIPPQPQSPSFNSPSFDLGIW
ncbi:hypothetical protein UlMin_035551, partial [Ulmus minor]